MDYEVRIIAPAINEVVVIAGVESEVKAKEQAIFLVLERQFQNAAVSAKPRKKK